MSNMVPAQGELGVGVEYNNAPLDLSAYIRSEDWSAYVRSAYLVAGAVRMSSRHTPFRLPLPKVGTWMIDRLKGLHGREIARLCLLDPSALLLSEDLVQTNTEGRADDAMRYAEWIQAGLQPPPIEVVQIADGTGRLKVCNGHRRTAACIQAHSAVLAWVSPVMYHPLRLKDAEGATILVGLTWEGLFESVEASVGLTSDPQQLAA